MRPSFDLASSSDEVIIGRLDAKGTGTFIVVIHLLSNDSKAMSAIYIHCKNIHILEAIAAVLMKKIFTFLLFIVIMPSFAQLQHNRHDRLTNEEFQELKNNKDKFIPFDLSDTVVIIKYSGQQLLQMQNTARYISFAKNGTDTTGLTNQSWLTEQQIKEIKISTEKWAAKHLLKLKTKLRKKGIESIVVEESKLAENPQYSKKYWLKTTYISNQKSLEDNGWVLTTTNLFYDPRSGKNFETYLPVNYSLIDLIE